jgi:hypothetical protein
VDADPSATGQEFAAATVASASSGANGGHGGAGGGAGGSGGSADPLAVPATGNFLISGLLLGEGDAQGNETPNGWRALGHNLDAQISTPLSSGHCFVFPGADPGLVKQDGDGGIDNAFGELVLPELTKIVPQPTKQLHDTVALGGPTMFLRTNILAVAPGEPVIGRAYLSASEATTRKFDGSDTVAIDTFSLECDALPCGLDDAVAVDFSGKLVGDELSFRFSRLPLALALGEFSAVFEVVDARVQLTLDASRGRVVSGIVGGALATEAAIRSVNRVIFNSPFALCNSAIVRDVVERAQDLVLVMSDGHSVATNGSGIDCSGISVGIGLRAVAAQVGDLQEVTPLEDCE